MISWWGEHKINHGPRWLPRGWLQQSLFCGYKNTAISGICGWWQLANTAASCPVSLNFNFMLLQSMYAPVHLLLRHSPKSSPRHLSIGPGSILSTILICFGSHFSPCTVPHYKNTSVSIDPSRPATGRKGPLWHHHNMTWVRMRKCRTGQPLHAVHTDWQHSRKADHYAICGHGWSLVFELSYWLLVWQCCFIWFYLNILTMDTFQ